MAIRYLGTYCRRLRQPCSWGFRWSSTEMCAAAEIARVRTEPRAQLLRITGATSESSCETQMSPKYFIPKSKDSVLTRVAAPRLIENHGSYQSLNLNACVGSRLTHGVCRPQPSRI